MSERYKTVFLLSLLAAIPAAAVGAVVLAVLIVCGWPGQGPAFGWAVAWLFYFAFALHLWRADLAAEEAAGARRMAEWHRSAYEAEMAQREARRVAREGKRREAAQKATATRAERRRAVQAMTADERAMRESADPQAWRELADLLEERTADLPGDDAGREAAAAAMLAEAAEWRGMAEVGERLLPAMARVASAVLAQAGRGRRRLWAYAETVVSPDWAADVQAGSHGSKLAVRVADENRANGERIGLVNVRGCTVVSLDAFKPRQPQDRPSDVRNRVRRVQKAVRRAASLARRVPSPF